MLTAPMNNDRRVDRSVWPSTALALQLARICQRHSLDVIVLADRGGNLWAASSLDQRAEALAALLPRLQFEPQKDGSSLARGYTRTLRVKELRVGAADLYLAAQGHNCASGVREATPGVQRILTALWG